MNNLAFLVSCQTYVNDFWPGLVGTNDDVWRMKQVLESSCCCLEDNIIVFSEDQQSIFQPEYVKIGHGIESELNKRNEVFDIVFFYFSGHGYSKQGEVYIAPIDAEENKYALSVDELIRDIKKHQKANQVVLILDCCQTELTAKSSHPPKQFPGHVVFYSCAPNSESYMIPRSKEPEYGRGSIFTYFISSALSKESNCRTVSDIIEHIDATMKPFCASVPCTQIPYTLLADESLRNLQITAFNNASTIWNEKAADVFKNSIGPAVPSESEMAYYDLYLKKVRDGKPSPRMLILGSTRSFFEKAKKLFQITVVDLYNSYADAIFDKNTFGKKHTLVIADWCNMADHEKLKGKKFDIIIGDLAIGNVEEDRLEEVISNISSLLEKDGYWLGRNWFRFNQKETFNLDEIRENAKLRLKSSDPEAAFSQMAFQMVSYCTNGQSKLDFSVLNDNANLIAEELSGENTPIAAALSEAFKPFLALYDNNIKFNVHSVRNVVYLAYKHDMILLDTGYGNDSYRKDFPLLVFQRRGVKESLTDSKKEQTRINVTSFLPDACTGNKSYYTDYWVKQIPAQYYIIRLCNKLDAKEKSEEKRSSWKKTREDIRKDVSSAVGLKLDEELNSEMEKPSPENMGTEVEYIRNYKGYEDQKETLIENYQLAVLLYLSSAISKQRTDFYDIVSKKISSKFEGKVNYWLPKEAPWITAKICVAAHGSNKIRRRLGLSVQNQSLYTNAIDWLLDQYDSQNRHNWECKLGSIYDTCAMCADAIMCYYDELGDDSKKKATEKLSDILNAYILHKNIYETIANHPLGEMTINNLPTTLDKLTSMKQEGGELLQKGILESVAFISMLVGLINFVKNHEETMSDRICSDYAYIERWEQMRKNSDAAARDDVAFDTIEKEMETAKNIMMLKLAHFWHAFSNKGEKNRLEKKVDDRIQTLSSADTCMVPQILYSLYRVFES